MNDLVLDIWHDLREKRLWPVAVLLVGGLLAIPVFLLKSGEEPTPAPTTAGGAPLTTGPGVQLAEDRTGAGSPLDRFDSKNPFKPPGSVTEPSRANDGAALGGTSGSTAGASGGSPVTGTGAPVVGGGGAGGGGATSGIPMPAPVTPRRKRSTSFYTYVVDIEFGKRGRERRRKGVKRLTMLPRESNPLLIFLGVSADRRQAIFLADSELDHSGEGVCRPSRSTCAFVKLTTAESRDEHVVRDENGQQWTLRLLDIRRVKVDPKRAGKSRTASSGAPAPASRKQRVARAFGSLLFADASSD